MGPLTGIGRGFLAPRGCTAGYGAKCMNLAKALLAQHVATVAGTIIHEMGHAALIQMLFKTPHRVFISLGGLGGANVFEPFVLSDLGKKLGLSAAVSVVYAAGPLTHAMSVLLCTFLWKQNRERLRMLNGTCFHGIQYALQHVGDYAELHVEGKSGYAYLVALVEIAVGSWSLYRSMEPQVSSQSLISRSVQRMERLEKSPNALNSLVARTVGLVIGLLLVGKMASSLLGVAWYFTIRLIDTAKKRRADLDGRVTCSLQEAKSCAQAIHVVMSKLLWKPSLARAELSRLGLCSRGWSNVAAEAIGLHVLRSMVVTLVVQLVFSAVSGQLGAFLSGRPIDPGECVLWKRDLSLTDSNHPERLLGAWRWMLHRPDTWMNWMWVGQYIFNLGLLYSVFWMLEQYLGKRRKNHKPIEVATPCIPKQTQKLAGGIAASSGDVIPMERAHS